MNKSTNKNSGFDAIVIGTGIGGLSAAATLSKLYKQKVLLLERHYEIGGMTHVFSRGKFKWDVGLHYVGSVEVGSIFRTLFDFLVYNSIKWLKMPDIFERFVYPDFEIEEPSNRKRFKIQLQKRYPKEKKALNRYFKDLKYARIRFIFSFFKKITPPIFHPVLSLFSLRFRTIEKMTVTKYMEKQFKNEELKAVLCSKWGDYGTTPDKAAMTFHAAINNHYATGGYYPKGGAEQIAVAFERTIEENGGTIFINKHVNEIIIENGRAVGVRAVDRTDHTDTTFEYRAPIIISDAGAFNTFNKFLPSGIKEDLKAKIEKCRNKNSAVIAFIGFKENPAKLGINGENFWIFNSLNHTNSMSSIDTLLKGDPQLIFLSFPLVDNENRDASQTEVYTAQIINFLPYAEFEKYSKSEWKQRPEEYEKLKDKIIATLISVVEKRLPGFRDLIEYVELSTPLSMEHFNGNEMGAPYQLPATPERLDLKMSADTGVPGYYLAGSDVHSMGIMGAFMGGLAAAARSQGLGSVISMVKKARVYARKTKSIYQPPSNTTGHLHHSMKPAPFYNGNKFNIGKYEAICTNVISVNETVKDVRFKTGDGLPLKAGQHVKIHVGKNDWRSYSIVSYKGDELSFLIDTKPAGSGSKFITDIKKGDEVLFRLPMENLFFKKNDKDKVFIATGIGVTPFIALIEELNDENFKGSIKLYFGCRKIEDDFASSYIDKIKGNIPVDIIRCISIAKKSSVGIFAGRVTDAISEYDFNPENTEFFICGNPTMIQNSTEILRKKGAENIYF